MRGALEVNGATHTLQEILTIKLGVMSRIASFAGKGMMNFQKKTRVAAAVASAFMLATAMAASAAPEVFAVSAFEAQAKTGVSYLDNGTVKIGVDLGLGGAITYLSKSRSDANLVNSHDWGRQIQMSNYSGPIPYEPHGKKPRPMWAELGWNPIQSGDSYGNRSRVLAHTNDGKTMYTRCIPMLWPLDNVPGDCTFETWISLRDDIVTVRCRLNNAREDKTQYYGRDQELPAVYTNGPWYRLVTYKGDRPFTNAPLSDMPVAFPWTRWQATENWSALVDKTGFGLGVISPNNPLTLGGFAGAPGAGGPKDSPTGYIAPLIREILDHNIQYAYSYHLVVGTLAQIRRQAATLTPRPMPPSYRFASDRQHWIYFNAVDTGWPIRGELTVKLESDDPQLVGPDDFWEAAKAPKLYVEAAFKTGENTAQIFWKRLDQHEFSEGRKVTFNVVPDGKFRVYEVNLASSPEYQGAITGLRLDPAGNGKTGNSVRVKSIGFNRPLTLF